MKTKLRSTEECVASFEIEVPEDAVQKAFDEVYTEITKVANIPGFRVGKAPKDMVKKQYIKEAKDEVLKRLIPEAYTNALTEHKVNSIGLPEITDVNFGEGKGLTFKARVDTRPEFKLKEYKGIKIEKKKVNITPDDVEKTLQSIREINAKYISVEDRPVAMGDYVVSDQECFMDGKPVHAKRENLWISIDKESLIPELSEKMVGMKKGEERDIEVTLPEKYPDKKVAGKLVKYNVTAKDIKVRQLPNLDDEFAKDIGKEDLAKVREEISRELELRAKVSSETETENQLLTKLSGDNDFKVPANFVKRQLSFMVENAKKRLLERGFNKEDLDKKDDEFSGKFKSDAVKQVKLLFILDEIAKKENIDVSDDDLKTTYQNIAYENGRTEAEIREYYEKEDLVDNLKDKVREDKTIKFLLGHAQIVEK